MAKAKKQTKKLLQEGGLNQEGGTVDPVSGNDVPVGSTQEEVRDDIPAQLSEGEFVFPADVVRFIGLDNLMKLRQEAKSGLAKMDRMGQMGNSEEAVEDDTGEFDTDIDNIIEEIEMEAATSRDSISEVEEPEEDLTEEDDDSIKKSDGERLGFNVGGLLKTENDSSDNTKAVGKNMAILYEKDNVPDSLKYSPSTKKEKITTSPKAPVAPEAGTKDTAKNILSKKYDTSTTPSGELGSQQLAKNILEKKYGKGITARKIVGVDDTTKQDSSFTELENYKNLDQDSSKSN